jgi:putative membrane protein
MTRWGLAAGLAAVLALFGTARAAGSGGDTGGPAPGGANRGSSKIDQGLQDKLERLHAANQGVVSLAKVGVQNAQSPDVKQFAEQMQSGHQRGDQKLTAVAQAAGVASLDGKTFQKESDRTAKDVQSLQSKTGTDFDKAFMDSMVKDHERAVKEAQAAAQDAKRANQPELAAYLDQSRTGLQGHLDHAKQIQKSLGGGGHKVSSSGSTPSGGGTGSSTAGSTPSGGAPGTSSDKGGK